MFTNVECSATMKFDVSKWFAAIFAMAFDTLISKLWDHGNKEEMKVPSTKSAIKMKQQQQQQHELQKNQDSYHTSNNELTHHI